MKLSFLFIEKVIKMVNWKKKCISNTKVYTNSLESATTKNLITTKLYLHMKAYCQFKRKIKLEILLSVYVRPSVLVITTLHKYTIYTSQYVVVNSSIHLFCLTKWKVYQSCVIHRTSELNGIFMNNFLWQKQSLVT